MLDTPYMHETYPKTAALDIESIAPGLRQEARHAALERAQAEVPALPAPTRAMALLVRVAGRPISALLALKRWRGPK